jgi:tRNA modification GTPase
MFSFSNDSRTIFAVASGVGRSAVGVIRVSGQASAAAIAALTGDGPPPARHASLRTLRDPRSGEEIDRGLILWFPSPHSYTGEDAAELQVTGGRAVLTGVLNALTSLESLRPAEPGEFAWRAFENRKLDLSQIEGLADLVDAQTQAQRRQALRIAGGAVSREAEKARGMILDAMARVEAALDFSDQEDVGEETLSEARTRAEAAAQRLIGHLRQAERGERLREGFNVVIAGRPNVGKSTLLNALARRDVAIVSDIPGTTRDILEVHLELRGLPVTLIDTAGLRDTDDPIEREGVARARRRAAEADLVLWLKDGGLMTLPDRSMADIVGPTIGCNVPFLEIRTKADLDGSASASGSIAVSAKTGAGLPQLLERVAAAAEAGLAGADQALLVSARHRSAFEEAGAHLRRALGSQTLAPEFFAEDLRLAARALERIAGRIDVEEVLGEIFGRLCIGK